MSDPSVAGARGHLAVVGLMASGKTSVAAALAARLGRPLRDSDADIAASAGADVRTLAVTEGVDAMHEREVRHLLDALAAPEPSVIAPAAFTVEDPACRAALAAVTTVWLDVDPAVLAARFGAQPHRPDFGRPVAELLADQHRRRAPLFGAVATLVVRLGSDDHDTPDALAERVLDELAAR